MTGLAGLVALSACGGAGVAADDPTMVRAAPGSSSTSSTLPATTTTAAPPLEPSTALPLPTETTAAPPADAVVHPARVVTEQPWVPYAVVGPVTLHHPSDHTEAIGFHQSGHDGAQPQEALPSAVRCFTLVSRVRPTTPQGAADIVVEPDREVRSPVTGTVVRGGTYTLYCENVDQYAVIEPDARPGWEVKVLHIEGLAVSAGDRVEAGVTVVAAHARVLPFPSQVEDDTGEPAWPHVHVEVVDPSIPDRPGAGCP
jgi:biotin carboxyl carrier protein